MSSICIQEERVIKLMDILIDVNLPKFSGDKKDLFIDKDEALGLMKCSNGTLQKLRDEQLINYFQLFPKLIIYDRASILNFIQSKKNII